MDDIFRTYLALSLYISLKENAYIIIPDFIVGPPLSHIISWRKQNRPCEVSLSGPVLRQLPLI